jgi:hypothetical protein
MKIARLAILFPLLFWYTAFDTRSGAPEWVDTGERWTRWDVCVARVQILQERYPWLIGRLTCLEVKT